MTLHSSTETEEKKQNSLKVVKYKLAEAYNKYCVYWLYLW